jgi:hypothetical protein
MLQQLKQELQAVRWPAGTQDLVFGDRGVMAFAGSLSEEQHPPGFPFALVTLGSGEPDPDDPDSIQQQFTVIAAVQVAGDPMGEFAVIGSSRPLNGRSAGAGIAEVGERVRAATERLTAYDGGAIVVSGSGVSAPNTLGKGKQVAFEEFTVSALCTSRPRFTSPQQLRLVGDTWSWFGDHCTRRFDFQSYVLGYVTGSTPATSLADITVVYTGTDIETAVGGVPGRVYHIFAQYNGHGGTAITDASTPDVGSYLVL